MNGIVERLDALAKAEGPLSDQRLEEILLAEQDRFEAAQVAAQPSAAAPVTSTSTATSKATAAPSNAQVYDALEKRATEAYPTLGTPAAVEKWVLANPDAYIAYRKAETDSSDVDAVAIAKGRAGLRNWAQAEAELGILIDDFMHSHRGLNKAQAVAALMKSDRYAQELYLRIRDHADARVDQVREAAVVKASGDWDAVVATTKAAMPDATMGEVLEAALHSPAGVEAARTMMKHDGGASERAQILGQIHALAVQFMKENPQYDYDHAFALVTKKGIGYTLHRRYLESK